MGLTEQPAFNSEGDCLKESQMAVFLSGVKLPWHHVDADMDRVIVFGTNTSAALYIRRPGPPSEPERHEEEQVVYFVSGSSVWHIGEEGDERYFECVPGSLLIVGPNERHWSRVSAGEEALELNIFSPPRESHRGW
jgi:quercetin dioxygenase-like cupin family protein